MKRVLIRADGSSHLGMGHIFRCLAFAEGLRRRGADALFVLRSFEDGFIGGLIRSRGFEAEEVPSTVGMETEVHLIRRIMAENRIRVIVTDVCHRKAISDLEELRDYHEKLKRDHFLIAISGSYLTDLPADLLVSPYFRTEYPDESSNGSGRKLLGPDYFIFPQEFIKVAQRSPRLPREARRILVTVGGGDEFHLTSRIATAIRDLSDSDLETRVVIGPAFSGNLRKEVEEIIAADWEGQVQLCDNPDMPAAMQWADLAITGDGLTKYETAVTGTPSIMLSTPNSEIAINDAFAQAGTTLYLGDGTLIEQQALSDRIQEVLKNYHQREAMSGKGRALVDGKGLDRIMHAIPPGVLE